MNLLPKNREQFSEKAYWESFFEKRGDKAFEWYGEYPQLCDHLHKYVKTKDEILIVGCGNSTLGNDMYDVGYRNITSIDISQVAIRQMLSVNSVQRPQMKFLQMDALNMSFNDSAFTAIIDKGTLDALMPDDSLKTLRQITEYFNEILRVLALNGRYVCVTLLQQHILRFLLEYFPGQNCIVQIIKCNTDSPMPVFAVVCTKFKALPMKVLEVQLGDKRERLQDEEEVIKRIAAEQQVAFICSGLQKTTVANGEDVSFEVFKDTAKRYTIYIVDVEERKEKQYAVFIVPQGREAEWLFSTKEGRLQLAKSSNYKRLAIATLHREQNYDSIEAIKLELADSAIKFAPATLGGERIDYLSLGPDVGERTVRFRGTSKCSGDYIVEDVVSDGEKFRRLFYLSSQLVIQSEAKIKQGKSRSGRAKEFVDVTYLTCGHHFHMSKATHIAVSGKKQPNILLIGLGGGGLCSFLRKFLKTTTITAVDIDEDMLKVATQWFGLHPDDKLKVEIDDGLHFLEQNKSSKYDAILFDVDSKDMTIGMSCPPQAFLSDSALNNVVGRLKPLGVFILNVVLRDSTLRPGVLASLKAKFKSVISYKLEQDLNEVFICADNFTDIKKSYIEATKDINAFFTANNNKDLVDDNVEGLLFN